MASPFDPVLDRVADAWRQWLPDAAPGVEPTSAYTPDAMAGNGSASSWRTWYNERMGTGMPTAPAAVPAFSTPPFYGDTVSSASSQGNPYGTSTPLTIPPFTRMSPLTTTAGSYGAQRFAPSNQMPKRAVPAGNASDIWGVIDEETGGDDKLARSMKMAVLLESGGDGNAVGDGGVSHGYFQINQDAHSRAITPEQSRDARSATRYMLPAFQQALQQVPDALWESDPRQAAAMVAYFAERPAVMYDSNTVASRWDQMPLRRMSYSASNAAQSMPEDTGEMLTIGQSRERWGDVTPDQFRGGLSDMDAISACGPAAAVAFARVHGRNPTLQEAVDLAKGVGWDPTNGMKGVHSQVALLNRMGIAAEVTRGVDWDRVRREVSAGRPVIIDTPSHYFVVEGYDPATGAFDFGNSARVLKAAGGRSWWSPNELATRFGANFTPRSGIYLS